jgi:hypothetical protein
MMILDSNSKSLQIVSTVASLEWTANYRSVVKTICNNNNGQNIPCSDCKTNGETNGVTTNGTVTMVAAPSASTIIFLNSIEISSISICNVTGSSATVSVQVSGTPIRIIKVTIPSGCSAEYEENQGWQFFNANGAPPAPGAVNFSVNEVPSGTINSSNVTFILANTPKLGTEMVYYNGQLQRPTLDYAISTNTITFITAPDTGTSVYVSYIY